MNTTLTPLVPTRCKTLGDLLRALSHRANAKVHGVSGLKGPRGPAKVRQVARTDDNGRVRVASLPNMEDDDALSQGVGRSICSQLGVDPVEYGFGTDSAKN